jgi:hypothetical protein
MDAVPQFVVAGIPLIVIVFALIEEVKAWGLTGKILRALALVLGLLLSLGYQLAVVGLPVDAAGWFTAVIVGLVYGLAASGAYNFLDARFPAKA